MKRQGAVYWIFVVVFLTHAIGFVVSHFRDDVQQMVWYGFTGLIWYKLADRERNGA